MKFNNIDFDTYLKNYPSKDGFFGKYGGAYISPELKIAMKERDVIYADIKESLSPSDNERSHRIWWKPVMVSVWLLA